MNAYDFFLLAWALLLVAFFVKNGMTCAARIKCCNTDFDGYLAGPSYNQMLFNQFRWTFAQHYPEIAKRVAP